MPHDSTESGAFRFKRLSIRGRDVPLVGQASRFCSRDACCLRDGAHAPGLAILVPKDLSSFVDHHDDYGVGLCFTEIGMHAALRLLQLWVYLCSWSSTYGNGRIDEFHSVSGELHRTLYDLLPLLTVT